jgi:hypothetical protein
MPCSTCTGTSPLCDACVDRHVMWHAGMARNAGRAWGLAIRRAGIVNEWPVYDGDGSAKLRAIAARKVAELAGGDARLLDRLARDCAAAAREAYESGAAPGSVSFTLFTRKG